jgi:HK97 family phage prohead protease
MKLDRFGCGLQIKFAGDETKAGTFSGYGSIFGNVDSYGDVVQKGAFAATLKDWKKRKSMPKMLLQHGSFMGPAEDGIPIGIWTRMEEDDTGLLVEGELFALDTQKGRYIHEGMQSGALDGLSIGYIPREVAYGKKPEDPARTIKKLDLFEVSVVTFPANSESRVESVKSIEDMTTLSDAEAYLRDVGLSRQQARAFVSRVKSLRPCDAEGQSVAGLIQRFAGLKLSHTNTGE